MRRRRLRSCGFDSRLGHSAPCWSRTTFPGYRRARPGCKQTYSSPALQGSFGEGHRRQSRQGRPLVASEMGANHPEFRVLCLRRTGDEPGRAGHPLEPDWGLTTLGFEYLVFRKACPRPSLRFQTDTGAPRGERPGVRTLYRPRRYLAPGDGTSGVCTRRCTSPRKRIRAKYPGGRHLYSRPRRLQSWLLGEL